MTEADLAALQPLFEIESAVETGVAKALDAAGMQGFLQDGKKILATPRYEVQVVLGKATGHQYPWRGLFAVYDVWDFTVIFRCVTNREKNGEFHTAMRPRIRILLQPFARKFDEDVLPYHVLSTIQEAGTQQKVEDDFGRDVSEVHFTGLVSIRTTAWPA
jgi:hypothetical protein